MGITLGGHLSSTSKLEQRERWLHSSILDIGLLWRHMVANLSYWEVMTGVIGRMEKSGTWIRKPGRSLTSLSTLQDMPFPWWPRMRRSSVKKLGYKVRIIQPPHICPETLDIVLCLIV